MAESIVLRIEGMTCGHCAMAVTRALKQVAGVSDVQVDLPGKAARVTHSGVAAAALQAAVENEGYQVVGS